MSRNISPFGSSAYTALAPYCNEETRAQAWISRLIDNQDGQIVNTQASLHYEDHKLMIDEVKEAQRYRSSIFDTLAAIPGVLMSSSISDTVVGYQDMNEFDATASMDGSNRQDQESNYVQSWVPQPVYHADFNIQWRQAGFAYKQGDGITGCTNAVMDKRDSVLTLGDSTIAIGVGGAAATALTGLTNAPGTLAQAGSMTNWGAAANKATVYNEAVALIDTMYDTDRSAQQPNSLLFMVANDVITQLELKADASNIGPTNKEAIESISAVNSVVANKDLVDGSVLIVEMSPSVIRIPQAQGIVVAPHMISDPMAKQRYTVFSASTVIVLQDRAGRSGVSYATKA